MIIFVLGIRPDSVPWNVIRCFCDASTKRNLNFVVQTFTMTGSENFRQSKTDLHPHRSHDAKLGFKNEISEWSKIRCLSTWPGLLWSLLLELPLLQLLQLPRWQQSRYQVPEMYRYCTHTTVPKSQGDPKIVKGGPKGDPFWRKRGPKIRIFHNCSQRANMLKWSRNRINFF